MPVFMLRLHARFSTGAKQKLNPIHSGTSTERIVRSLVLLVLVAGFGAWSLWDGYVGYPRENIRAIFEDVLGTDPPNPLPAPHPSVSPALDAQFKEGDPYAAVAPHISAPGFWNEQGNIVVYIGHRGFVRVELDRGGIERHGWVKGPKHSATDLVWQKGIGYVLMPVTLLVLLNFARVIGTRASLTDEGLKLPGRRLIALSSISAVRDGPYRDTHWIDYDADGTQQSAKLDAYVITAAPAIVAAIRQRLSAGEQPSEDVDSADGPTT